MDQHRPIFHFMPEKNWMNDPNGLTYYNGEYHLFYQYNPNDYCWGTIHWGHAKSKDLIHWERLPIALYPSKELGEIHCFSGCAVIDNNGVPMIFYTSVGDGERNHTVGAEQWIATSKDGMLTWEKHPRNPIMTLQMHHGMDIKEWRDPFVWKEEDTWYMVLGGSHDGNGCVLIYCSKDLLNWSFLNIMYETRDYRFLECPNMLKYGDKYVLVFSPSDKVKYLTGKLNENFTFLLEYASVLDNSGWEGFYAPNTLKDPQGRYIMWGWMTEVARGELENREGWAGAQSIPRILTLGENGKLKIEPAFELEILRYGNISFKDFNVNSKNTDLNIRGRALEISAEIEINGDVEFSIQVLRSINGEEVTSVRYNSITGELTVERSRSTLSELPHRTDLTESLPLQKGESLRLRIFVDHSIIEVFANHEVCISTRIYPVLENSDGVGIQLLRGDNLEIKKLDIWKMKSIWE